MGSAAEVDSPRKAPTWRFYKSWRDSIPFLSVSSDSKASSASNGEADIKADKAREDPLDTAEGAAKRLESLYIKEDKATEDIVEKTDSSPKKPKNKDGKKKKPIVSSSTVVPRLEVCIGKKCKAKGSEDLLTAFQTASNGKVEIAHTKCMHECKMGMNTRVTKDGTNFEFSHEVTAADVEPMLCKHFDW
jgi:(2Fe-2S) ferredoxin